MLKANELKRYSQQIKLQEIGVSGQEKLKSARVLCIGLGGLGSPLLLYLAAAGVGTLGVMDDDEIELDNLHRQIIYDHAQVGIKKALAAKDKILAINPLITVDLYPEKLNQDNASKLIEQYDLIADCTDNFYTRYLIHDLCFRLKKPYVYASATQFQGYCSIFNGQECPCLRCLFPKLPNQAVPNCAESGVLGGLTGILGIMQATEIIKWILKIGLSLEQRLLQVDLLTMHFKEIKLVKNPQCKVGILQPILEEAPTCFNKYALSFEELKQRVHHPNETLLIDVRTYQEHEHHNIGGQVIPLQELAERVTLLDSRKTIILYCASGKRSLLAVKILLSAGFRAVHYLKKGIDS